MRSLARGRDRAELLERLRRIEPATERRWGRMSAHQMICHLSDAFRMAMGTRHVPCEGSLVRRTSIKLVALYLPLRWPPGIETRPEIEQGRDGTCPGEFAADVAELAGLFELFVRADGCDRWPPHPFFGRLSRREWMRWGYLHTDHHLRQFGA